MELARVTKTGINIASETELLSYTYSGTLPREVLARVDLGDTGHPIVGNGTIYSLRFYINTIRVIPNADVFVPIGLTKTILVSRPIAISIGDIISIRVVGQPGDASVDTVTSLRDVTGLIASDVFGAGAAQVDHNYGGPDALAFQTASGVGIDGATILIFSQADYLAGNIATGFAYGRSLTTAPKGEWNTPVWLPAGTWVVYFTKPQAFYPATATIVV